ncbi:nitrate/nitrite two-component system sensor histidine kinase NarX [Rouxiella sp. T17]|uniref:nitrate/nitrite two-component system sensor histidine kinase NarX n=1 Tax=Rouxiella sp. T17 TaxID=3085684 RepID=UPI002FCC6FF7
MLLSGLLGIGGMSMASWMAQSIQGNAHAINKAGSLRMQSYRLLVELPLNASDQGYLRQIEDEQNSQELLDAVRREGLQPQYRALQDDWLHILKPLLLQADNAQKAKPAVVEFVTRLDELVAALDQKTERHLTLISAIQIIGVVMTLLVLLLTVYFLRLRLHQPWRQLLLQAEAITQGDFSQRYRPHATAQNEMDRLGESLDTLSQALAQRVENLAKLVDEKTASLSDKNQTLDFLYRASQRLHTSQPLGQKLPPVLQELQQLTPLREVQLRLYDTQSDEVFHEIASQPAPIDKPTAGQHVDALSWRLRDGEEYYGLLLAQRPLEQPLSEDHQQLVSMLLEQLAGALTLERQTDNQQQLMLMEERSTIARELHDSLAQSLSCLKIQVACLQMQNPPLNDENNLLIKQMREELNTAYRQLRELLTTFRLKLDTPGLRAALQNTVDEFSRRIGVCIHFDYQLPPGLVAAHQGVHLLQIAREALNNIYKHAQASRVSLSLKNHDGEVEMQIIDNGCGLPENALRQNHYGLMIMQDRARSLHGECSVTPAAGGGTRLGVRFHPSLEPLTPKESA